MHQGSCLCGSIRYVIDDNLKFIVNCHCRFCRKAHGAAFTSKWRCAPLPISMLESKRSWYPIADGLPQFSSTPGPAEFAKLRPG